MKRFLYGVAAVSAGAIAGIVAGSKILSIAPIGSVMASTELTASSTETGSQPTVSASTNDGLTDNSPTDIEHYRKAAELAEQATAIAQSVAQSSDKAPNADLTEREREMWARAISALGKVSNQSGLHQRAAIKQAAYQQKLEAAERKVTAAADTFIGDIVRTVGVDAALLHVTVCELSAGPRSASGETANGLWEGGLSAQPVKYCLNYQGDEPMASTASLIKLPIAIALIAKAATGNIDIDDDIVIDPKNFTENAVGFTLKVSQEYSLRRVMTQMIKNSDNIATNQLLDYLGYPYINQTLKQLGYAKTSVGHKLIGAETAPADFGEGINQSTTNEITAMMAQVYSLGRPEELDILAALSRQEDIEFGYKATQDLGPTVKWLGEKTGQNNLVIASTMAVEIDQESYVITVALDGGGDIPALREVIRRIAIHLKETTL
ncbi:MAG: serine hydrolase [Cyanobacteria bacterium J06623_5]